MRFLTKSQQIRLPIVNPVSRNTGNITERDRLYRYKVYSNITWKYLERLDKTPYPKYSTFLPPGNSDPYIKAALHKFDNDFYHSLHGYTRKPAGIEGLYKSLGKFEGRNKTYHTLSKEGRRAYELAVKFTRRAFRLEQKAQPLVLHKVPLQQDTSAGWTFKGLQKRDCMEEIYMAAKRLSHFMKNDGKPFHPYHVTVPPCMTGQRGHLSKYDDPKTRLLWVYPAEMLAIEGMYTQPLYDAYQAKGSPLLNGAFPDSLCLQFLASKQSNEVYVGLDFSSFDTSIPSFLIHEAFSILHDNIDWDNWDGVPVPDSHKRKWGNVWKHIEHYFINTTIVMPDGKMFRKHRGIPSGSWFTQLIGSVVNALVVYTLAFKQGVTPKNLVVLGDDSAFKCRENTFSLDTAALDALFELGMDCHPDKCELTAEPSEFKLLGFIYPKAVRFKPTEEWFKLALYPEFVKWDLSHSMARMLGLYISGACADQKFCKFFNFFQSSFPVPNTGQYPKDVRRYLTIVARVKSDVTKWHARSEHFWKAYTYV